MKLRLCLALAVTLMLAAPAGAQQTFGAAAPTPPAAPPPAANGGFAPASPAVGAAPVMGAPMQQMQAVVQQERQDFGVPPQAQLQPMDRMHGPTPTSIPGGQLITTDQLFALYQQAQGQPGGPLIFDVLGGNQHLPFAQNAVGAAQPGSFHDQVQQEFGQYLQGVTQGNKATPMVFYCQGTQCWMSYNAALRAINLGYTQVYWYRGGVEAWNSMMQLASSMPQPGMNPGMGTNPGMNPGAGAMPQQGMYPQGALPAPAAGRGPGY